MANTTNILNLLSEETFADKMDKLTAIIAAGSSKGDGLSVSSWADVQKIVRMGLADKVFNIGDQLVSTKGDEQLVWDIIGIDQDTPADKLYTHSMTIQMHGCYGLQVFDAPEALYYYGTYLIAGTYHFTIPSNYDASYGGGKTLQFTLTKQVPAGGQVCFSWPYNTQASAGKISTYASPASTTAIETVSVKEGSEGEDWGTIDGAGLELLDNHIQRVRYGYNNWAQSAIRQWLNSNQAAGAWWTPQNNFDRPPAYAATTAGFLNGMDSDFLSAIGKVKKNTALNTVTDGGGSSGRKELMFLLSKSEVYAGFENSVNEGEPYAYYKNNSDLSSASTNADLNRVKNENGWAKYWWQRYQNSWAKYWWLRTPASGLGSSVFMCSPTGSVESHAAGNEYGVAPACCIV